MAKERPVPLYYFLTLVSGGLFAPFWLYLLMRDTSHVAKKWLPYVSLPTTAVLTLLLFIVCDIVDQSSLAFMHISVGEISLIFGLLYILLFLVGVVWTYRELLLLEGRRFGFGSIAFAIATSVLGYFCLAHMQYQLNHLERARATSGGPTVPADG